MPLCRCQGKWATQRTVCRLGSIWHRTFPELPVLLLGLTVARGPNTAAVKRAF